MNKTTSPPPAQSGQGERSTEILQAFLDMYTYPVWISDETGTLLMNGPASSIFVSGTKNPALSSRSLTFKGRRYQIHSREMNHGTGCRLNELRDFDGGVRQVRDFDDGVRQLRESTNQLAALLDARAKIS
jgi:hypothetical protein